MSDDASIDTLWNARPPGARAFAAGDLAALPDAARRYLTHAIAAGAPLATAVRLRMHGQIKLRGWHPFTAQQVIRRDGAMLWRATVRMHGLPIHGFDRLLDGAGAMRWKLFGLLPIVTAAGPDITRSAAGRVGAEFIWLPSALCGAGVGWSAADAAHASAALTIAGETVRPTLTIDADGRPRRLTLQRWGNPDGARFGYAGFGGVIEDEASFDGYTIPTRLRIGWHPDSDRFDADGEFFRVSVDHAQFR